MFTVVLLNFYRWSALDPALVESPRNAWGGGDAIWLAPDEAEFSRRLTLTMLRFENCQSMGVDLLAVLVW
jgi:phosphoserine phosphatase